MNHLVDMAIKKSQNSSSKFKISAVGLNHKGEILGQAFNRPRFDRYGGGVHAEMALLNRYGNRVKTIILCRTGNSGDILPIDPCVRCQKVLDKKGIKVVTVKGKNSEKSSCDYPRI